MTPKLNYVNSISIEKIRIFLSIIFYIDGVAKHTSGAIKSILVNAIIHFHLF